MPFPAYSVVLWDLDPGYSLVGGDTVVGPGPPGGYVWVIRQVAAFDTGTPVGGGTQRCMLLVDGANVVWGTPLNGTIFQTPYEARDVRYVMEEGSGMSLITTATTWSLRVSGYQLTA